MAKDKNKDEYVIKAADDPRRFFSERELEDVKNRLENKQSIKK